MVDLCSNFFRIEQFVCYEKRKKESTMHYIVMFSLLALCSCNAISYNNEILENLSNQKVDFISLLFTDPIHANLKEVLIPFNKYQAALKTGLSFDSSSIPGFGNKKGKDQITESDMVLKIDQDTTIIAPQGKGRYKIAQCMCDVFVNEHEAYAGHPRTILKQALDEAHQLGYSFVVGPELEFFLTHKNSFTEVVDQDSYFSAQTDSNLQTFKCVVVETLQKHGIDVEKWHHEVAIAQHEMSFKYDNALAMADQLVCAKHIIQALCKQYNYEVTFMPKPYFGINGSGMHLNVSLFENETGKNAFYEQENPDNLSNIALHFIAGILNRLKEITLILNPTINSYKRLVPGYEAPRTICWGKINRSSAIRIPLNRGVPKATRIELRSPDPKTNPYLAFTLMLKAGLEGIKNQEKAPEPLEENVFHLSPETLNERMIDTLPATLQEAIDLFSQSAFARSALGEQLFNEIIKAKQIEAHLFATTVTNWELSTYF